MNLIPACRATSTKRTGLPDERANRRLRWAANAPPVRLASIFRRVHPRSVLIRASLHHRRMEGHPKTGLDTAYHIVYNRPEGELDCTPLQRPNSSPAFPGSDSSPATQFFILLFEVNPCPDTVLRFRYACSPRVWRCFLSPPPACGHNLPRARSALR